jgi:hypothetical protein
MQLIDRTMKRHFEVTLQHFYMNSWLKHEFEEVPNYDIGFLTIYKYWLNSRGHGSYFFAVMMKGYDYTFCRKL